MGEGERQDLETLFAQVEDPRMERTKRHRLRDIMIIAMCGVICGAEGWVEIEAFGKAKEAWLTELLDLPNGIPSHNTPARPSTLPAGDGTIAAKQRGVRNKLVYNQALMARAVRLFCFKENCSMMFEVPTRCATSCSSVANWDKMCLFEKEKQKHFLSRRHI
jgi:DDE_Tnp_1-associated